MSNYVIRKTGAIKIGFTVMLFLVAFVFPQEISSQKQDTIITQIDSLKLKSLKPIENDTIKGIFNKIIQFIKFRENRNKKREEQIHDFLDSLIVKGELRVDSLNLNLMVDQINEAFIKDSLTINKNKQDIEASKIEIDSLSVWMDLLFKELSNKHLLQKKKLNDTIETSLKDIKRIQYSMGNIENASLDSLYVNDDKEYFKRYLKTKKGIQVIGWHNAWNDIEYKNYNYNYLTSINLYGFALGINGEIKNEKEIIEFQKEGGVIDYANKNGCDVSLTIYNKYPHEITKFLNDVNAQTKLTERLKTLIIENKLKGINIYFEDIPTGDHLNFVEFMTLLSKTLNKIDETIDLNLTIPSIYEDKSLEKVSAYDFIDLNEIVDYYIVLTDRMTSYYNRWAQSASPLYTINDNVKGSIESTINFYSNGKIPVSKLLMSVSYLGLDWDVKNARGKVVGKRGYDIEYREIMYNFIRNKDLRDYLTMSFDSVQVASYLDLTEYPYKNTQIWYEDSRSLSQKYKWALEGNLGGVSIRGLGYDDGFPDLWNVLGTNLIEIDTFYIDGKVDVKPKFEICAFTKYKDSLRDFKLATWKDLVAKFQSYDSIDDPDKDSKAASDYGFFQYVYDDVKWASLNQDQLFFQTKYFNLDRDLHEINSKYLLDNDETCKCLLERWVYYYHISRGLAILCFLLAIAFSLRIKWLDRYNRGGKYIRILLKYSIILLSFMCIFFIMFWAYMNPNWEKFGASNNGDVSILLYLFLSVMGVGIGMWLKKEVDKGKYVRKNLP